MKPINPNEKEMHIDITKRPRCINTKSFLDYERAPYMEERNFKEAKKIVNLVVASLLGMFAFLYVFGWAANLIQHL